MTWRGMAILAATLLATFPARAVMAPAPAVEAAKARTLLAELRTRIAPIHTTGLLNFEEFPRSPITNIYARDGLMTYFRWGDVRFHSRQGGGYDITPEFNSIALLQGDSLYLQLSVAPPNEAVAFDHSFDLAPYLPGQKLFVYYRENIFGQSYLSDSRLTPTEYNIYRAVAIELAQHGIRIGKAPQGEHQPVQARSN